ncbi:hypothetical protein HHI36_002473 [Cryptolaemus montrouzieri]|uniref:Uncharacterized protein n=1 Tax=Cryptolaemus montrouzieri TaxID=559131 RepID=A0ABD2PBH6_9CUCU
MTIFEPTYRVRDYSSLINNIFLIYSEVYPGLVVHCHLSPHDAQTVEVPVDSLASLNDVDSENIRIYSQAKLIGLKAELGEEDWSRITAISDPNETNNSFFGIFHSASKRIFTQNTINSTNKRKQWITLGIRIFVKRKMYLHQIKTQQLISDEYYRRNDITLKQVMRRTKFCTTKAI